MSCSGYARAEVQQLASFNTAAEQRASPGRALLESAPTLEAWTCGKGRWFGQGPESAGRCRHRKALPCKDRARLPPSLADGFNEIVMVYEIEWYTNGMRMVCEIPRLNCSDESILNVMFITKFYF